MDDLDALVEEVRRGERDGFARLIQACHVPVRALISALVHDPDDADDLAQQTFVFAYQRLAEYQIGTRFLSWLKAIARNMVLDYHKRAGQRRENLRRYLRLEIARQASTLAGVEALDPRLELLERCVGDLPDPQRSFLRLAHDRAITLEELAGRLRRSAAAVRKQLSRLHELLRECVDRRLHGAGASS